MENKIIYLDHGATTPIHENVFNAMRESFLNNFGNASSLHSVGEKAKKSLENSRKTIADFLGVEPKEIIFTSGGTESDNIAILGTARTLKDKGKHIITSNFEHPAVRNTIRHLIEEGFDVTEIPIDNKGLIHVEDVERSIRDDTILISIMWVNNEIGTIQSVEEIAELADKHGIIFHTDAVQAYGKIRINLGSSKIHLLSASAHKIYGPKGIGLLYIKNGGRNHKVGKYIKPILFGGGHEFNYRPSTENVPGIVGFAEATKLANSIMDSEAKRLKELRDDFIDWVLKNIPESYLNGDREKRLYNNINMRFKYVEGESMLLHLDDDGIMVSTGSACSSKSLDPSHVLTALGIKKEDAHGSLRLTLGISSNKSDLEFVKLKLQDVISKLRKMSPLAPESYKK